jgi:hypothetical protein
MYSLISGAIGAELPAAVDIGAGTLKLVDEFVDVSSPSYVEDD